MSFAFEKLRDPGYFRENRMDAHSDHIPVGPEGESLRMSLNGAWRFFYALNEEQVIEGFEKPEYDCRAWEEIPVPAHVQMEGYGHPQYCNTQYPWDGTDDIDIGEIPTYFNPVACYCKYFTLPESWEGERVIVSFQGAESCVAVWLNGEYVGFASDSFTPDEFELTKFLKSGENKLACRVYRFGVSSWLEDQDFMRFSGLFRDVYLERLPEARLADLKVRTMLDESYTDAVLEAELRTEAPEGSKAILCLTDGESEIGGCEFDIANGMVSAAIPVKNPRKWSAEKPELYTLGIVILGKDGKVSEKISQKVGFRRFEMKDGIMCLNGQRIVFKGVNRHDFCAETGRAVTKEKIWRDLVTMKRNNINAVRTSHYPNTSALYAMCDELGLYVIDECNMETHGIWDRIYRGSLQVQDCLPGDRMDYLPMMLDRVHSMVERDKNHACILIWSCGNESYGGRVILEMSREMRRMDETRLVHYEGVAEGRDRRYPETTDMDSQMYTPVEHIREWLAEHDDKPFILCEYTHSMGNSNGAMHKYTRYAYEEPRYQGGFIWDYIDQSIVGKDRYGQEMYRYGGDYDDRPNDGDFSGNGICFGSGEATPKMQEVKYNYRNIEAEVTEENVWIRNRFLFRNTGEFECVMTLKKDGKEIARTRVETNIAPLSEGGIPQPFGKMSDAGEYTLDVSFRTKEDTDWADAGHEIAWGEGVWTVEGEEKNPELKKPALRVTKGDRNVGVIGDGFRVMYSMEHGTLISYQVCGREMLKTPPRPAFWRAPIDNDRGNGTPARYSEWKIADLYARPLGTGELKEKKGEEPVQMNDDGSVSFVTWWMLPGSEEPECRMEITVKPGGETEIHLTCEPKEGRTEMPLFGVQWKMDADFDRVKYYGLGPDENYNDRREGARLGIYRYKADENMTKYLYPQECGNRTGVRWAEITDLRGRGVKVSGNAIELSVLPWTAHEIENADHANELPQKHYTVVRPALMQMGVGGDNSWGARTHPEYLLPKGEKMDFTFRIAPKID